MEAYHTSAARAGRGADRASPVSSDGYTGTNVPCARPLSGCRAASRVAIRIAAATPRDDHRRTRLIKGNEDV